MYGGSGQKKYEPILTCQCSVPELMSRKILQRIPNEHFRTYWTKEILGKISSPMNANHDGELYTVFPNPNRPFFGLSLRIWRSRAGNHKSGPTTDD
jgi:hypothetical protein